MAALPLPRWKCISWRASVVLAECLCVLSAQASRRGYAMASLRQQSAALVAGGSSRFCYQIDRVAEHLGVTLFKFMAGTLAAPARFSPYTGSPIYYQ